MSKKTQEMTEKDFLLAWNVIDEHEYRKRVMKVFDSVCKALLSTFGPYGASTMIEHDSEMHQTKDGWLTIMGIQLSNSMADKILSVIKNICSHVVLNVGDGTTTSIVSADRLYKNIVKNKKIMKIRSKELLDLFDEVSELVCNAIVSKSFKVTDDVSDVISKIANIATNGDKEITDMLTDIYSSVDHPIINYKTGLGTETKYEIIKGYKTKYHHINPVYRTNDNNECQMDNPLVMIFDHKIDFNIHFKKLIQPVLNSLIDEAMMNGYNKYRRLVIFAPYFDQTLLDHLNFEYQSLQNQSRRANVEIPIQDVFCKCYATSNAERMELNDMSAFCGCEVIREDTIVRLNNCTSVEFDLNAVGTGNFDIKDDFGYIDEQEKLDAKCERREYQGDTSILVFPLNLFVGQVKKLTVSDKYTLIEEFNNVNQGKLDTLILDAKANIKESESVSKSRLIEHTDLADMKNRLAKLQGKIVNIDIGGESEIAKQYTYDVIDDAIKACNSALDYGYNIGGSLIIPIVIDKMLKYEKITDNQRLLLDIISKSFKETFGLVLGNKYNSERYWDVELDGKVDINNIVETCVVKESCFNLITDDYSNDIINPSLTDIEIIKASLHILSLLLDANQYITMKIDGTAYSKDLQ